MLISIGDNPQIALSLIDKLGLYDTIFTGTSSLNDVKPSTKHWSKGYSFLDRFIQHKFTASGTSPQDILRKRLLRDPSEVYLSWLLVSLLPWGLLSTISEPHTGSKTRISPATQVAKEGIKTTARTTEIVSLSFQNAREISNLCNAGSDRTTRPDSVNEASNISSRAVIGLKIRRWGSSWRSQIMLSLLLDIASLSETSESRESACYLSFSSRKSLTVLDSDSILEGYAAFIKRIEDYDLLEACSLKPVLDGKTLISKFSLKPGPGMKIMLDAIIEWQLANPDHDQMEDALAMIMSRKEEFGIQ